MFGSQARPGMRRRSLGATAIEYDFGGGSSSTKAPPTPPKATSWASSARRFTSSPIRFYAPTGHTAYHHVGADLPLPTAASLGSIITAAAVAAGAYHGYKRTHSAGWAVGWALLAGLAPIIVIPVALAQGFGKPRS